MKIALSDVRHSKPGFEALVNLYEEAKECSFDTIEIDMAKTSWFDADMCAAFGAILYRLGGNINTVKLNNINSKVEQVLLKNGFLSYYGSKKIPDTWGTTIPYHRFDVKDDRYFAEYVESELMQRSEVPVMSAGLRKKFQEGIFEIFSNAVLHSQTKHGIYSCGQFFPARDQLNFSVADLGVGICKNIKEILNLDLSAGEAIVWATTDRNTTKRGQVPGGLGLKLLSEFVELNEGCIQIVSDKGYWKKEKQSVVVEELSWPFPGTVVTIEINTSDTASYSLSSELTTADIF